MQYNAHDEWILAISRRNWSFNNTFLGPFAGQHNERTLFQGRLVWDRLDLSFCNRNWSHMGVMRFLVSQRDRISEDALSRIYMTGQEEIPWQSRVTFEGDYLVLEREVSDSGNVHFPWLLDGMPEQVIPTASLVEREKPYLLEVELARGILNNLRNQIEVWRMSGLVVPSEIYSTLSTITRYFASAATSQAEPEVAARHAEATIRSAYTLLGTVGKCYTDQALAVRRRNKNKLTTLLGINLGHQPLDSNIAPLLAESFNTAVVPLGWRQIEVGEGQRDWSSVDQKIAWCQQQGLKVCAGPILQLDPRGIPDWTYLWEGDFENLLGFILEHTKAVAQRYKGKIQLWQVASRVNHPAVLSLTEEQRLRIVAHSVEAVRAVDPNTPVVVSFNQPWAEYMAKVNLDLSPLHFADTLARADLGLAGVGLEMNVGYAPGGTLRHSLLAFSRQLDRWSLLGLPLMLSITAPSAPTTLPGMKNSSQPISGSNDACLTPEMQRAWVEQFVPLMLAKNCVQVIVWNHLQDKMTQEFPSSGLIDTEGQAKPAIKALQEIRRTHLT